MTRSAVVAVIVGVAIATATWVVSSGYLPTVPTSATRVYNLDPDFGSARNDLVWDPNFIPGFAATPMVHLNWSDPTGGPGTVDYHVGPWASGSTAPYPHFSVGPQAFNFVEVPRTQVYRSPMWGDYTAVATGLNPCAVSLGNLTVSAARAIHPVYVGLPENGTAWTVDLAIHWRAPATDPSLPASGRVSLVTTTSYPPLGGQPGARLAYTNLVLWSLAPLSAPTVDPTPNATEGSVGAAYYPVDELPDGAADRSYSLNLAPYLASTATGLGLPAAGGLLSYVYLSTEGFNTHIQFTIGSLALIGPASLCSGSAYAAGVSGGIPPTMLALRVSAPVTLGWVVGGLRPT